MVVLKIEPPSIENRSIPLDLLRLITNPVAALVAIHKKHGELVATSFFKNKMLFVSKPEHLEEVYSLEARNQVNRDFLHDTLQPVFFDGLINSKHDIWIKQRRLMQPLFTKESVKAWEQHVSTEANAIISGLKKITTAEINLSRELKTLVQNIFIKVLFGQPSGNRNDAKLTQALDTALNTLLPRVAMETLGKGKLKVLFSYQEKKYKTAITEITNYVYQEIDQNKEHTGSSILAYLIQAEDKKTGYSMTKELLRDEVVDLFIAGQDTTINVMTWFFYLIGKHETVHKKITEEITQHKNDPINSENLAKLIYTKATLYETLRLYPPAPGLIRQTLDDVMIGGQKISKGTAIILSIYATHRNKHLWERPDEFYPEHFWGQLAKERHKYAFMPFGGGVHNCIGRHFSELEMMIIITTLLREFTIKAENDIKGKASVTLKADRNLIATLTPISN